MYECICENADFPDLGAMVECMDAFQKRRDMGSVFDLVETLRIHAEHEIGIVRNASDIDDGASEVVFNDASDSAQSRLGSSLAGVAPPLTGLPKTVQLGASAAIVAEVRSLPEWLPGPLAVAPRSGHPMWSDPATMFPPALPLVPRTTVGEAEEWLRVARRRAIMAEMKSALDSVWL